MATIWKYPLAITDVQTIALPSGAHVLTVQMQNGTPCLWAIVIPGEPEELRQFRIYGTGNPIGPGGRTYLGTFQLHDGQLVFHVFEEPS